MLTLIVLCIVSLALASPDLPFGGSVFAQPCQGIQSQKFTFSSSTHFFTSADGRCLATEAGNAKYVETWDCSSKSPRFAWQFNQNPGPIMQGAYCLTMYTQYSNSFNLGLAGCSGRSPPQQWSTSSQGEVFVTLADSSKWCLTVQPLPDLDKDFTEPMVIGHRGTTTGAPENTMPAFSYAARVRAQGFETDLRFTKDDVLVLLHDDSLDRTTNCSGKLRDYTLEKLRNCDACAKISPGLSCTVPTFEEALKFAQVQDLFILMDLKESVVERAVPLIKQYNMQGRVLASCWTQDQLGAFYKLLPSVTRHRLQGNLPPDWSHAGLAQEVSLGVQGYSINFGAVAPRPEFVAAARAHMMSVFTWTDDDEDVIAAACKQGHSAVITDSPLLAKVLIAKERAKWKSTL